MRLEVLADSKGAVIYVLNREEIYVGSVETNDIVIPSSEVSRKHLKLIIVDNKCFAIDQGSTNGSFINDERLIPGRREEFKMLTSIRLGEGVLLTLLDKDKGDLPEMPLREQFAEEKHIPIADEDKTRVISLKKLQKVKTEKVRKKRLKTLEAKLKKKKVIRKDKATLNNAIIAAFLVLAGTYAAMKVWDLNKVRRSKKTVIAQIKETRVLIDDTLDQFEEGSEVDQRISKALLIPVAEIAKHSEDVNCSLPEELFFCKRMPRGSRKKNGVFNYNRQLIFYIEQKEWLDRAEKLVTQYSVLQSAGNDLEKKLAKSENTDSEEVVIPTEDNELASMENLNRIAFLSFIKDHLSGIIPPEYMEFNFYLVFYSHAGNSKEIVNVLAIKASSITSLNQRYSEDFFKSKKIKAAQIIKRLNRFYRFY